MLCKRGFRIKGLYVIGVGARLTDTSLVWLVGWMDGMVLEKLGLR